MIEQVDRLRRDLVVEEAVAALAVDVAGDRRQQDHRTVILEAVGMLHGGGGREHDLRRATGRIELGGAPQVGLFDAADRRHPLRRESGHVFTKGLHPVAPFVKEGLILPAVFEDQVMHAQRQRAIGARADLQVHLGLLRQRCDSRVHHHRGAAGACRGQRMLMKRRDGTARVGGPHQQAAGGIRGHGGRGLDLCAEGHLLRHLGGGEAAAALGQVVGRAEGMRQALELWPRLLGVAGEERGRRGTVRVPGCAQALGDGVQRLVPGDALELAAAARARSPQRVEQALRVVAAIQLDVTARTVGTVDLHRLAVRVEVHVDCAVRIALVTGTFYTRHRAMFLVPRAVPVAEGRLCR